MKKPLAVLILFCLLLIGCSKQEHVQITATTLPVYEFTKTLCDGTGLTVTQLVTEEVSCLHDYTVQVSQMRAVETSEVVICSGAGLEEFLDDVLKSASRVIDASVDVSLHCIDEHGHDGHDHAHDPHIWLSPKNATQMANTICAELSVIYPEHKAKLEANLSVLLQQLDTLQTYGEEKLNGLACRELITFHDGFSYFAESFGLNILKAVEEESGSEASAKELIELIDLVQSNRIPAIFTEVNGSTAAAEIICAETGAKDYKLDMAMSGRSYFDAMYRNINTIKEALG